MSDTRTVTPEAEGAWAQSLALSFRFLFLAICLLGLGWAVSNCRMIQPDSRAIVLRFGTVVREENAGLLLALPRPFEQVMVLPSGDRQIEHRIKTFQSKTYGYTQEDESIAPAVPVRQSPRDNAGMLLTGDMSVIHYEATLFYRITNAKAYVLAQEQVAPALERLFVTSAIAITSRRDLDAILVARPELETSGAAARASRERLRSDLMDEVNRRLTELTAFGGGFGVTVGRVDLVPQLPAEAKGSFDSVLTTLQRAETDEARARTDAEMATQVATQTRDRITTDADARAAEQVREAESRTAAIAALSQRAPGVTGASLTNQIYSDRIGPLLGQAKQVLTTDGNGGAHLIIPGSNAK